MKARIKLTLKCNRACPYCINKCPDYREKWVKIENVNNLQWETFSSIVVSGGEPLLKPDLYFWLKGIRIRAVAPLIPIYLQTNGDLLSKEIVKEIDNFIDGIGISVHDLQHFKHLQTRFEDIARIKPIQLYVQDTMYATNKDFFTSLYGKFSVRVWKEGEFDKNEVIYVLKE